MRRPLTGIKVLDLSRVLSGPYCTMILGDFGAEVTKVELPDSGDDTRAWGPPWLGDQSAYFLSINRNKKSITINMKDERGLAIVHQLAKSADVVVENFRPGTAERLGVGFDTLQALNPRLVYCSISGFGQTGPYSNRPGYDAIAQAMGGIMSVTGYPHLPPVRAGTAIADIGSGMWAALGILAALHARETTGRGQWVDTSLIESQVSWLTYIAGNYFASGATPERYGSAHPNIVPYQAFETRDGYIMIAVGNQRQWLELISIMGLEELGRDERFSTNADRVTNRDALVEILTRTFKERPTAAWIEQLEAKGIPSGPINSVPNVFEDPHIQARDMVVQLDHPTAGPMRVTGVPVKFSDTPAAVETAPPLLGQHTDEVLAELGYDAERIAELHKDGIV